MQSLWQDLRYGLRLLRLNPAFTVVAVVSLALGIGANTSIFQLIDAVRLRTIPVENPEDLATVRIANRTWRSGNFDGRYAELTYPIWQQIRQQQEAFSAIGAFSEDTLNLATGGEVRIAKGLWVTGDFFHTLGVRPAAGRLISESDDQPGCASVVSLSYAFWQREYGGETSAIGRQITLEGHPFQIVGVTSPMFRGIAVGETFDVAIPACADTIIRGEFSRLNVRRDWWLAVIGRLKPGWTTEKATAQLHVVSPRILQETIPETYDAEGVKHYLAYKFAAFPASTGFSTLRSEYEKPLWLLLGIAGLVLLIACANLANLLLARGTARQREISVRLALGASRGRLIRQLLSEGLLLAIAGATCGAVLARELSQLLIAMISTNRNPIFLDLSTDWRILGFTTALAVLTALLFGLTPAFRATNVADPNSALKATRGMTAGRERFGIRRTLVVTQVALSVVLLVSALLFVRSFRNLLTVDAGFQQKGILIDYIDFTKVNVPALRRDDFKQELVDRLRAVPGVDAVAGARLTPLGGSSWNDDIVGNSNADEKGSASENFVSPGYFATLETPVIQGRDFNSSDTSDSPKVAIVNQAFARKYLDTKSNPIGKQFRVSETPGKPPRIYEVIGIVKDTKYQDMHEDFKPIMYFPTAQDEQTIPLPFTAVLIRSSDLSPGFVAAVRDAITRVNPAIDIYSRIFSTQIRESLLQDQLMATLSGFFGFLAALLAAVGLYGVMSYMVAQRTNEIGIRMALGAQSKHVLAMILSDAGVLVLVGAAVGTALALLVAQLAAALLFGLRPRDPLTYIIAIVVLSIAAALASYWPAYRASKLDPIAALHYE